jgi:DNA-dependent RNA polymerase auxiliary subunit epsilon
MNEYRVKWCACPHVRNTTQVLFVEAGSPEDARAIARDHIERVHHVEWFTIFDATPVEPRPPGRVLGTASVNHQE